MRTADTSTMGANRRIVKRIWVGDVNRRIMIIVRLLSTRAFMVVFGTTNLQAHVIACELVLPPCDRSP